MARTKVAWLDASGRGVGPHGDRAQIHLAGALPGEAVTYRVTGGRKRHLHGEVSTIEHPSPDRRTPPCPFDARCGGCDLSHVTMTARHRHLAHRVAHVLRRDTPPPVHPSPRAEGHRARISLAMQGASVGYRAEGSHELVDVDHCRIARPELAAPLEALRAWRADHPEAPDGRVSLRTDGERTTVEIASARGWDARWREALAPLGHVAVGGRAVHGDPVLHIGVGALSLRARPGVFYQVNLELNEILADWVASRILEVRPERVLDLYAGFGNLGLTVAHRGVPVAAVERQGRALGDLEHNARAYGLTVAAHAVPAERHDMALEPFDAAILDPPRAGSGPVLDRILRSRPKRVVYVSCHLDAAAREIRRSADRGYRITEVAAFDLFPETHHLEVALVLDRT